MPFIPNLLIVQLFKNGTFHKARYTKPPAKAMVPILIPNAGPGWLNSDSVFAAGSSVGKGNGPVLL